MVFLGNMPIDPHGNYCFIVQNDKSALSMTLIAADNVFQLMSTAVGGLLVRMI